jgi:predicted alpha-1,6-mannanase (GH76 family)
MRALSALVVLTLVAGLLVGQPASAAATVCAVYCDTRDPSLARQELFPVPERAVNGRRVVLHVSNVDAMAWGSIDNGTLGDAVWLDRSWDGGATWDGLLGKASTPGTWTGTRTLMYNLSDPSRHRRGVVRACGDAHGIVCTDWVYPAVCVTACDNTDVGTGDYRPVPDAWLSGRRFALHFDDAGMAWGTVDNGRPGDEVWLDRSWDAGASWPGGSSLGRTTSGRTRKFHTGDPGQKLYGGAVRACGRAIEGQNGACTVWARPASDHVAAGLDALMWSYDPWTAYWPSSWWNSAVALTTVIDAMAQTGRRDHLWIVNRTFEVNRVPFPPGARSGDAIDGHFISRAIDDSAWWALAWVRAYDLTGEQAYLNEAVTIADYVAGFWDGTCGGGVWWDRERTYKNAVTNGLYVRLTAALHNRLPGDSAWLARARTGWQWFTASGMINSANLVNDGITSTCVNNGQPVWSYNQGLAIGAAVELWRATGDAALLATARRLADAGTTSPALVSNGVLTEICDVPTPNCGDDGKQFKGIFMRYLADLNEVTGGAYLAFARTQSDAVWSNRDSLHRLGQRWSGGAGNVRDWRTQASGLSALLAAASGRIGAVTGLAGKCVDVSGSNTANGTPIQLWTCNATGAQIWTVRPDGTIRALGKCVDITYSGTANGTLVQLWECNGTGAQVWQASGGGSLRNPQSGRCLDASGANSADGTRLQIWDCHGGGNQAWQLPA